MKYDELVGFLVTLLALAFVIGKSIYDEWRKQKYPEVYAKKQKEKDILMREFLKSIHIEEDKEGMDREEEAFEEDVKQISRPSSSESPRPYRNTPRTVQDSFKFKTKYDGSSNQNQVENRSLKNTIAEREREKVLGSHVVSEDMQMQNTHDTHAYDLSQKIHFSRGKELFKHYPSRKHMLIIYEIFGPPKGFRK